MIAHLKAMTILKPKSSVIQLKVDGPNEWKFESERTKNDKLEGTYVLFIVGLGVPLLLYKIKIIY